METISEGRVVTGAKAAKLERDRERRARDRKTLRAVNSLKEKAAKLAGVSLKLDSEDANNLIDLVEAVKAL